MNYPLPEIPLDTLVRLRGHPLQTWIIIASRFGSGHDETLYKVVTNVKLTGTALCKWITKKDITEVWTGKRWVSFKA